MGHREKGTQSLVFFPMWSLVEVSENSVLWGKLENP